MIIFRYCLGAVLLLLAGCGQRPTSGLPTTFNQTGTPTIAFSVPDMMCAEGCGTKTKQILSKLAGAKDVYVDFDTKTATVAIEEGTFDVQLAVAELVDHGFEQSQLKSTMSIDAATLLPENAAATGAEIATPAAQAGN